jgi:hypothetical protein
MSAFEIPGFSFTLPSAADLSASGQFRFVNVNSSGQAIAPTAAGEAIGVRQNSPIAGEATTIVTSGIVMVEAGETVVAGEFVKCMGATTAAGAAGDADTTNDAILGVFLTGGAAGELVSVLLAGPGKHVLAL